MKKVFLLFLFVFSLPAFATGINGASAPCDNATLSKYNGTADIEINWEPNTIGLTWYDGDTQLNVPTASQTCTYDGMITVPAQPTKPGYTFNGWKVIHVPGGYTELEYVTNAANTYLNTGIIPNVDDIEMEIKVKATGGSWYIFQNRNTANRIFGISGGGENNTIVLASFGQSTVSTISRNSGQGHIYIVKGTMKYGNKTLYVKDLTENIEDTQTTTYNTYEQQTLPLWLFGNQQGAVNSSTQNRALSGNSVYYVKMRMGGVDVMNYIPARRNSDNAVGFYDTISGTFKTVSEGSLTAGPVVQ